ncbi:hypothetical protein HPG69_002131, partial [Diceros bicornis minor]
MEERFPNLPCFYLYSIDVSGGTRAQSMTQPDVHITVSEGARMELRGNYSTSLTLLSTGLQLLLKYTSGNSLVSGIKTFEVEFKKTETSFHPRNPQPMGVTQPSTCLGLQGELNTDLVRPWDFLSLKTSTWGVFKKVKGRISLGIYFVTDTKPEEHISVFEGALLQVKGNYSYSGSPVLFWYVQYPKQGLQLLLKHISGESIKGFTADLNKGERSFHLKKPSAQEEDSTMYYCALSATVTVTVSDLLQGKRSTNPLGVTENNS